MRDVNNHSVSEERKPSKSDRRINFGRRRSDWLIPILLLFFIFIVCLMAARNRLHQRDLEEINKALNAQTELRERQIRNYEKELQTPQPRKP